MNIVAGQDLTYRRSIVALLLAATTISYIDRQTLAVVAPVLRDELGISNSGYARIVFSFLLSYTIMQGVTGWLIDRLGTRRGFALIMAWWSAAAMLHGLGQGVASFSFYRFLLGAGQAGSWAASVRAVAEWFPPAARGAANGVWGAGTSLGAIVAVPVVAWITLTIGWRMAFVVTGLSGLIWLAIWLSVYHVPTPAAAAVTDPRSPLVSYRWLLRSRRMWALILARAFCDPVAWFYFAWVPETCTAWAACRWPRSGATAGSRSWRMARPSCSAACSPIGSAGVAGTRPRRACPSCWPAFC